MRAKRAHTVGTTFVSSDVSGKQAGRWGTTIHTPGHSVSCDAIGSALHMDIYILRFSEA